MGNSDGGAAGGGKPFDGGAADGGKPIGGGTEGGGKTSGGGADSEDAGSVLWAGLGAAGVDGVPACGGVAVLGG